MEEPRRAKKRVNKIVSTNIASAVNSSSGYTSVRSRQKIVQRNGRTVVISEREERRNA
jgi:ribosomal protein L36